MPSRKKSGKAPAGKNKVGRPRKTQASDEEPEEKEEMKEVKEEKKEQNSDKEDSEKKSKKSKKSKKNESKSESKKKESKSKKNESEKEEADSEVEDSESEKMKEEKEKGKKKAEKEKSQNEKSQQKKRKRVETSEAAQAGEEEKVSEQTQGGTYRVESVRTNWLKEISIYEAGDFPTRLIELDAKLPMSFNLFEKMEILKQRLSSRYQVFLQIATDRLKKTKIKFSWEDIKRAVTTLIVGKFSAGKSMAKIRRTNQLPTERWRDWMARAVEEIQKCWRRPPSERELLEHIV